jgi:signal transduction histidine kinase
MFLSRLTMTIVCSAIAMLMFFQLIRDRKSRIFGQFMLILAVYSALPLLTRMVRSLDVQLMFNASVILIALIPVYTFYLVIEYVQKEWRTWQKLYLRFEILFVTVPGIILSIFNQIHEYAYVSPEGLSFYRRYPQTQVILGLGEFIFIPITYLCIRRLLQPRPDVHTRMVIGLLFFCLAALTFLIPPLYPYNADGFLFAAGSLLMTGVVLNQRLFNPMAELNQRLEIRAEQFATLTRVAQQTTSLLSLSSLLNAVAIEIRAAFHFDGAAILLQGDEPNELVCAASAGVGSLGQVYATKKSDPISSAALDQRIVAIEDIKSGILSADLADLPHEGSVVIVPLIFGSAESQQLDLDAEQRTIGVLRIYRCSPYRLSEDDREVLTILSRQLAIAIRNAELYDAAEEARRVADKASEAKTRFMSTMSHELRTPLTVVINMSQFCQKPENYGADVKINEAFRADLQEINRSGNHLLAVINHILDWSKLEAGAVQVQTRPVRPTPILDEVISQSKRLLKSGVVFERAYSDSLPHVSADELHLAQILLNLLSNACKFTDSGRIVIGTERTDDKLTFRISDTGCGISTEAQRNLFTRFTQADTFISRIRGGTGLGLAISKQLVELQHGQMWCESIEGAGSTFYFTLPIVNAPEMDLVNVNTNASRVVIFDDVVSDLPQQILVIDAKGDDWDHLGAEISRLGHRLVRAAGRREGVQLGSVLKPSIAIYVDYKRGNDFEEFITDLEMNGQVETTRVVMVALQDTSLRISAIKSKIRELTL